MALRPVARLPLPTDPVPEVVEAVERLLALAKEGKLRQLAWCALLPGEGSWRVETGYRNIESGYTMLGAVKHLSDRVSSLVDEQQNLPPIEPGDPPAP